MKILTIITLSLFLGMYSCSSNGTTATSSVTTETDTEALTNEEVLVPAGTFSLGAEPQDSTALADERPQTPATVNSFYMSEYEITCAEFAAFINWALPDTSWQLSLRNDTLLYKNTIPCCFFNSTRFTVDSTIKVLSTAKNRPMTEVSWYGTRIFCNIKSDSLNYTKAYDNAFAAVNTADSGFRLATEAEWEWAARSGRSYWDSYYPTGRTISSLMANFRNPGMDMSLAVVGTYAANSYGLYDMAGNVWEWCESAYTADYSTSVSNGDRIIRGGGFHDGFEQLRTTRRGHATSTLMDMNVGFRVVRTKI